MHENGVAEANGAAPQLSSRWQVHEAPASCCLKFTQSGVEIMYTMRDVNDESLFPRVKRVLEKLMEPKDTVTQEPQTEHKAKQWCLIHECWMKQYTKGSRKWFAHNVDGTWCHGR